MAEGNGESEMEQFLMQMGLPHSTHDFCGLFVQLQITFFSFLAGCPCRVAAVAASELRRG